MPQKTPLKLHIFGKIERDGYSIEKVYIQTMPGFYLAGNLYRPFGRGPGPFPGVLNPHGHWKEGRLADTKDGSVAARCISFARQGMVAFSYDMVGFNDTHFSDAPTDKAFYEVHRSFGAARTDQLWNISLMGLQTWNSIRALDFLESLPEVDKKRLACTGESGGGTQTFMLARLMIDSPSRPRSSWSHTPCKAGAVARTRPVCALNTPTWKSLLFPRPSAKTGRGYGRLDEGYAIHRGPAIAHIYDLCNARDKFDFVRFDFGHNYNQTSREAVYSWFGKWLLSNPDAASLKEASFKKEQDSELRVFPDGKLPADAMTREQFTESLKRLHRQEWDTLIPKSKAALEEYKQPYCRRGGTRWVYNGRNESLRSSPKSENQWPIHRREFQNKTARLGLAQPCFLLGARKVFKSPGPKDRRAHAAQQLLGGNKR